MLNLTDLKNSMTTKISRGSLVVRKNSPEILLGAGLVGVVVAAVMAAKATLKAEEILKEKDSKLNVIKSAFEGPDFNYNTEEKSKDTAVLYVQTGLKFAKLYGPSVSVGALSIAAILASHGIMQKRQVSLVAAYTLLSETYQNYRARVVEDLGEDADLNYHLGLKDETHTETVTDEEGKKTKVKTTTKTSYNANVKSIYSRFFDESNPQYRSDRLLNKAFLQAQQNYANDLLTINGHVFLNEVYERLGFPHTKEGAIVGWFLKDAESMKEEKRDGYIDFGMYDVNNDPGREFINLTNPTILLDFNVDGIIFDLL